jgi:hypothetical protein
VQQAFLRKYRAEHPLREPSLETMRPAREERYAPPAGHDAHREHHRAFYAAIRAGKPSVEDAVFGFRAAGPALLANTSYFEKRICTWDPERMVAG